MEDARAIIVVAAREGNLEEVRRLVQRDRGLLDADGGSWEWTPLTAAALRGHVEIVRYLLDEGARPGLRDPQGWSALELACLHGHLGTVSLLLAHGADAGAAEPAWGMTPLMRASEYGHADIVALLLTHGCGDIDRQDTRGVTALHYACNNGDAGVVRALLGAGADPHIVHHEYGTPLTLAVRIGHDDDQCVRELQVRLVKMSWCSS
jgi:ankyrin repeat protein